MKNTKSIGMLAAVAFAVGIVGFNFSSGQMGMDNSLSATTEGSLLSGHLELIHTDKDGNILTYLQTDNAIMNEGRNCAAKALFTSPANTVCTDETPIFDVIAVGNGSLLSADNTATALNSEITGNGLARKTADTISQQQSATGGSGGSAIARLSADFTLSGMSQSNEISQAGLFNSTSTGNDLAFAMKNFPANVTMNNGDQLTVNWDITISGTDAIGP